MAIKRPIPRAEGVSEKVNDEVLFSSQSILMTSGKTLQEEWDEHLKEFEKLKESLTDVKEFVGDHIPVPYQVKRLVYIPSTYQEPEWKGYNSQFMTKAGQETGMLAGEYEVTFKLKDPTKYSWADGSTDDKKVYWYIDRQSFTSDPVQEEPYPEYNGELQKPVWKDHTDRELDVVGGDSECSGAGTYEIYLKPKENYAWHDGGYDERRFTWKITRKKISLPVQEGIIYYDGKVKTPTWDENGKTTLVTVAKGDKEGTDAKTYYIWFKPTDNAMWQDGSTDMRETTWTISAAAVSDDVTGPDGRTEGIVLTFNGSNIKPAFKNYDPDYIDAIDVSMDSNGNVVESTTIEHRNVGSYVTKFTPNSNSTWTNGLRTAITIKWAIQKMSVKVPSIKYKDATSDIKIPYAGEAIGPELVDYDDDWVMVTSAKGINVGEYTTKFTLKEANNTCWEGGDDSPKSCNWYIIPRLVDVPKLTESVVPYNNGLEVSPTIEKYDTNLIKVSGDSASNVGDDYKVKFELRDPNSSAWNDETHSIGPKFASWSIVSVSVAPLTITGDLFIFNGSYQGPTVSSYDTQQIEISNSEQKDVGKYKLIVHLRKPGIVWSDTNDSVDKVFEWEIKPKKIQIPSVSDTTKVYNTETQYVKVEGNDGEKEFSINSGTTTTDTYDSKYLSVSGASGKNAGSYSVKIDLKDKKNTEWDTGVIDTQTVSWTISKKPLDVPTVTGTYSFNGSEQTCSFQGYDSQFMTVSGHKATSAGSHQAKFSLTDTNNTAWSDNTTDPKIVVWNIAGTLINPYAVSVKNTDIIYDGNEHKITTQNIEITNFSSDIFRVECDEKLDPGEYTFEIYIKEPDKYQWTDSRPATEPMMLYWYIRTRMLKTPSIRNPYTLFTYTGKPKEITWDDCKFGTEEDKNFITLKSDKRTDAGTYWVYFTIKQEHLDGCKWEDGDTADYKVADWKINKAYIDKWSVSDSSLEITGPAGSSAHVFINRPGDGEIRVQIPEADRNVVSTEIKYDLDDNPETYEFPVIYFTDTCVKGNTTAVISIKEGTNYYSSATSSEQNSSCKASFSCPISVNTTVDVETITPEQIVDIIKKGSGRTAFPAGTVIPIKLSRFRLSGSGSDYIPAGKYGAVVLGHDHDTATKKYNSTHTMTLAIMKYYDDVFYNSIDGLTWLKKNTTIAFMDRNCNAYDLHNGLYNYNVFRALPGSWQGIVVEVENKEADTVFQLAVREVYDNGYGYLWNDDKNTVKQYDYFKTHNFDNEKIYPIYNGTANNKIRVGSRSVYSRLQGTPFLNSSGRIFDKETNMFIDYDQHHLFLNHMTLDPYYSADDFMVGMIPCFVIGDRKQ